MIYLMRHGAIETGAQKRYIGQLDLPLNSTGREQARWWREKLASVPFERIITSDLKRAYQTAAIIAEKQAAPIHAMAELREIDMGEWDGRSMASIRRQFPYKWEERGRRIDRFRPPGGESFRQLSDRAAPVIEKLAAQMTGPLLMVAHAGVNRTLLCHVLGMPLQNLLRIAQDFSALNLIEFRGGRWRLAAMNLTNPIGCKAIIQSLFTKA